MATEEIISLTEFKNDASGWIERLQSRPPVVITQNGRGRAVVQSYEAYRQMQNSLAMTAIVARGEADVRTGRVTPQEKVFSDLRRDLKTRSEKSGKDNKRRA